MSRIITIKDKITQETRYPVTTVKAIITEDGQRFEDVVNQKVIEINQTVQEAIVQAEAAEQAIATLSGLGNTSTAQKTLESLKNDISGTKNKIAELENILKDLKENILQSVTKDDLENIVTGEASRIPSSVAVRNFIVKKTTDIMEDIIETTSIEPNYIPKDNGKILVNTDTNEIFIAGGNNSNVWLKFNATPIVLEESVVESEIKEDTVMLSGDTQVNEEGTIVLNNNNGNVIDDTLIL